MKHRFALSCSLLGLLLIAGLFPKPTRAEVVDKQFGRISTNGCRLSKTE
jgi:hypothetical protein